MFGGLYIIGVIACFLVLVWMVFNGHFPPDHHDKWK